MVQVQSTSAMTRRRDWRNCRCSLISTLLQYTTVPNIIITPLSVFIFTVSTLKPRNCCSVYSMLECCCLGLPDWPERAGSSRRQNMISNIAYVYRESANRLVVRSRSSNQAVTMQPILSVPYTQGWKHTEV